MTDSSELLVALDSAAADLEGVGVEMDADGSRTWSRGGTVFSVLTGSGADLRIGATIADAAVRTPDTTLSARGPDWVTFSPPILDDHARDRLEAWFAAAHRRAVPGA